MKNGTELQIVSECDCLWVLLTPKRSFQKHVEKRNTEAKIDLKTTGCEYID